MTCASERVYTVRVRTIDSPYSGTDDPVYLTMYDASGNACVETLLDSYGVDDFAEGE